MAGHESDEVMNGTPPIYVSVDIPAKSKSSRRRVLHRVPPQLRENKKHIYDPVVLSLGPYHHGRVPQFRVAEQLKEEARTIVCGSMDKGFLLGKISERVDEIQHFYGGADEYGDEELGEMMLRDACFVLCYIQMVELEGPNSDQNFDSIIVRRLGMSGALFVWRDFFMLENQIPLWLLKLLFSLTYNGEDDDEKFQTLLCNYLSDNNFGDYRMTRLPWEGAGEEEEEPLHLLEANNRTSLVQEDSSSFEYCMMGKGSRSSFESANSLFRSVRDLKAKGIHLGPSSYCLKDIRFYSLSFYGKLQLPIFLVTNNSSVYFSNVIAFEMSPETPTEFETTSYVNFMKTLIQKAEDARELREKGILYSLLESDEDVVRTFQGIDTYGFCNQDLFYDVKMRIDKHCNNKGKTWMAELLHTYFRSPWTAIALFAAIFIMCLTFLQTYYTIDPANRAHSF
ncbi:hypothetical protein C2S53_004010 [Perilla frutescens var. hirtella]|uniref:Uncharacterized protein n=1 Tax=Perilla frutescens var. hirtella TaxID=608512 RepID=A0AAD4PCD5_PERFH|nr:hypothetical protein C2S53_004010 [Perilla frutescens var. hirtella]